VSVRFHRGGWEVRWRDSDGRERSRRLPSEAAARAFDEAIAEVAPGARRADTIRHGRNSGVYSYATASGTRWRFVYRRTDGTQTTKRGWVGCGDRQRARRLQPPAPGPGVLAPSFCCGRCLVVSASVSLHIVSARAFLGCNAGGWRCRRSRCSRTPPGAAPLGQARSGGG
jgi:hypothetical protein